MVRSQCSSLYNTARYKILISVTVQCKSSSVDKAVYDMDAVKSVNRVQYNRIVFVFSANLPSAANVPAVGVELAVDPSRSL